MFYRKRFSAFSVLNIKTHKVHYKNNYFQTLSSILLMLSLFPSYIAFNQSAGEVTKLLSRYGNEFNAGIEAYKIKDWNSALTHFKAAINLSDYLMQHQLIDMKLDTNGLLLAGASAQSLKYDDEAKTYFERLAKARVTGVENEFLYQFLLNYFLQKGNLDEVKKYLQMGSFFYPYSQYFKYELADYALAIENQKVKFEVIQQMLSQQPTNYKVQSAYGEILFDLLSSNNNQMQSEEKTYELELRMVDAFEKATSLNPNSGLAMSNIGNYYINKTNSIGKQLDIVRAEIRAQKGSLTNSGNVLYTEQTQLDRKYEISSDLAIKYYSSAVDIYKIQSNLSSIEVQQYKAAVGYLIDFTAEKKNNNVKDKAKFEFWSNEEKKWTIAYSKLISVKSNDLSKTSNKSYKLGSSGQSEYVSNSSAQNDIIQMTETNSGSFLISCELNDVKMNFIFDSGASDVAISLTEASFMLKNGFLEKADIISKEQYRIANGQLTEGFKINIRKLKIGNQYLYNVVGSISSSTNAPLLLGMSAIKKLGYKFDPIKGVLFK